VPAAGYMRTKVKGGIGNAAFVPSREVVANAGVARRDIHAGLNGGGYTWARFGPKMTAAQQADLAEVAERFIRWTPGVSDSKKTVIWKISAN